MSTWGSEYKQNTREAHHKLTLDLPRYMCGVPTDKVAVSNKYSVLQLIDFFIY